MSTPTPLGLASTDFSGGDLPENWRHFGQGTYSTGVEHLAITLDGSPDSGRVACTPLDFTDGTATWQLPTSLTDTAWPFVGLARDYPENNLDWYFQIIPEDNHYYVMHGSTTLAGPTTLGSIRWFRFVLSGNTISYQVSGDGSSFSEVATNTTSSDWTMICAGAYVGAQDAGVTAGITAFEATPTVSPGTGITLDDLHHELQNWLDSELLAEPNSLPALNYNLLTNGTYGLAALQASLGDISSILTILTALQAVINWLSGWDGSGSPPRDPDWVHTEHQDLADEHQLIYDEVHTLDGHGVQHLLDKFWGTIHGNSGIAFAGSIEFDDQYNWDITADYFIVTITSWPETQAQIEFFFDTPMEQWWLPRVGWYALSLGAGYQLTRQYIEFAYSTIDTGGKTVTGIGFHLPGCHVQVSAFYHTDPS